MSDWEQRKENAAQAWSAMSVDQQQAILDFLRAWQGIRTSMSELCDIGYGDLRSIDIAWYGIRNNLVDSEVEIEDWQ